jgi:hypothetical protein
MTLINLGILLALGLAAVALGFWGAYRWKKPWDTGGALLALLGLGGALLAALLFHVPDFFRSP